MLECVLKLILDIYQSLSGLLQSAGLRTIIAPSMSEVIPCHVHLKLRHV